MTRGVGYKIGETLGDVLEVEVPGAGVGWGRCMRLRINLDLGNPLERGRALLLGDKSIWVMFKYEKLPNFCFNCGRIQHGARGCLRAGPQLSVSLTECQWGSWLRAEGLRKNTVVHGKSRLGQDKGRGRSTPQFQSSHGGDVRAEPSNKAPEPPTRTVQPLNDPVKSAVTTPETSVTPPASRVFSVHVMSDSSTSPMMTSPAVTGDSKMASRGLSRVFENSQPTASPNNSQDGGTLPSHLNSPITAPIPPQPLGPSPILKE
ncbi:hypothetical protein SLA2020_438270 [Shorea laevis]